MKDQAEKLAESLAYARRAFGVVPVQRLTPTALADWSASLTGKGGKALAPATKRRAICPAQVGDGSREADALAYL